MLSKKNKEQINKVFASVWRSISDIGDDLTSTMHRLSQLTGRFNDLERHLANNGVIRDIRALQREVKALGANFNNLERNVDESFDNLNSNGVVREINKLQREVFGERKDKKTEGWGVSQFMAAMSGEDYTPEQEATLAGKVDAIMEHLGLTVEVKPKEVKEAKLVVKKAKKGKK